VSLKSAPYYWVECDRCGVSAEDGGDFTAWQHPDTAEIAPEEAGWHIEGGNHLCVNCTPPDRDEFEETP